MGDTPRRKTPKETGTPPPDGEFIDLLAGQETPPPPEGGVDRAQSDGRSGSARRLHVVRRPRWSATDPATRPAQEPAAAAQEPDAEAGLRYAWRCECGWLRPVHGDGSGLAVAMRHNQTHRGRGEHDVIQGLVDRQSGELVLTGFDSTGFQRLFQFGKYAPKPPPGTSAATEGGAGGGGSRGGGKGRVTDLPTRRLRVLADDIAVGDLITVGFHMVSRRLPELVPPQLLADETSYRLAMGRFLEDCVLVVLDILTQMYPDRFSPDDVTVALVASEVQAQIERIEEREA